MITYFKNIKTLINTQPGLQLLRGEALSQMPLLHNAWLKAANGYIESFGPMEQWQAGWEQDDGIRVVDCSGRLLMPAWVDSHTHLVFAAPRQAEFVLKIEGASYAQIAAAGGGIHASARAVQQATEEELLQIAWQRLQDLIGLGTGAIEIKSGYGLTPEAELKMLRVIARLKARSPIPVKATFLGAHAMPPAFAQNRQGYLQQIEQQMLPAIAAERLADYIDVFCEEGFFSVDESRQVLEAGMRHGLVPKIHANQLHLSGGVQLGVALGALSVDHLEQMDAAAIETLAGSNTIGTLLPTAAMFLRMPYPPARALVQAGCAIALASDYNPGSSPSGNMNLVVALSCINMRLTPVQAMLAATTNAAHAMQVQHLAGSIAVGKRANLILTRPVPNMEYLPYAFGHNHIEQVFINGQPWQPQRL